MSFTERLARILARSDALKAELAAGHSGENSIRAAKEFSELEPLVARIMALGGAERALDEAEKLLGDPELGELAAAEAKELGERIPGLERDLRVALLPRDAADEKSAILELRPAAGGAEAALFAARLFAMYRHYAEVRRWRFEVLGYDPSDLDGLREGIADITGKGVFARLKFESGVHRVQRVPETESQGRIHTSTVTVAVLPEAEEVDVAINDADLRIDVFRASGAGGQHVNKTESAVRVTHLPSGIVVSMQEEKSQHKNRAKAMKILRARLYERNRAELAATRAADRRAQVGTGDRSERIRTYNFPQGRVTDHRIGLTLYKLDRILEGDLDPLIDPLLAEDAARRLAAEE
ncbi:MAG: peptide chain release factor 1 [Acetobacteraceae bacterium]